LDQVFVWSIKVDCFVDWLKAHGKALPKIP